MVSELEEFAGLVLKFNNLWHAPNTQHKDNQAELLSLLEEMRDHEPVVRVILETLGLELIPICDDFSKVINFVPVTGMQPGGAVHVCKTLEEGRPELAGYLRLLDTYEETSRGGPADPDGQTLAELCRRSPPSRRSSRRSTRRGRLRHQSARGKTDRPRGRDHQPEDR